MSRCSWVGDNPLYIDYHDNEWGRPQKESRKLFEQLCLEGQQAGLAWITVLKKREHYRQAFFDFDPERIATMSATDIDRLMENRGLIRHRKKLEAIVKNACAYQAMEASGENFSDFIWSFVGHQTDVHNVPSLDCIPTKTALSVSLSRALKKKGFSFVGETTCYAFMQAVGMVDDHHNSCECKAKLDDNYDDAGLSLPNI